MAKRPREESKEGPEEKKLRDNGAMYGDKKSPCDDEMPVSGRSSMGPFASLPNEILVRVLALSGPYGTAAWVSTCRTAAALVWAEGMASMAYRDAVGATCDSPLCLGGLCDVVQPDHLKAGGQLSVMPLARQRSGDDNDAWWGPCERLLATHPRETARPSDLLVGVAADGRWPCAHLPPSLAEAAGPLASWAMSCAAMAQPSRLLFDAPGPTFEPHPRVGARLAVCLKRGQDAALPTLLVEWGICRGTDMEGPGLVVQVDSTCIDVRWAPAWSTSWSPPNPSNDRHAWETEDTIRRVRPRTGCPSVRRISVADSYTWVAPPRAVHHIAPVGDWFVSRDLAVYEDREGAQAACVATRATDHQGRRAEHWCMPHSLYRKFERALPLTGPGLAAIRIGPHHFTLRSDILHAGGVDYHRKTGAVLVNDMVYTDRSTTSEIDLVIRGGAGGSDDTTTVRFIGAPSVEDLMPESGTVYLRKGRDDAEGIDRWQPAVVMIGASCCDAELDGTVRFVADGGNQALAVHFDSGSLMRACIRPTSESSIRVSKVHRVRGSWRPTMADIQLGPDTPLLCCRWRRVRAADDEDDDYRPPVRVTVCLADGSRVPATLIEPLDRLDDQQRDLVEKAWAQRVNCATICWRAFFGTLDAPDRGIAHLLGLPTFRFRVHIKDVAAPVIVDCARALVGPLYRA